MTDSANRILWTIVGAVLTLLGLCGVLLYLGLLPAGGSLLSPTLIGWWHGADGWNLIVVVVVGVALVLLGLWLFSRELRTRGATPMHDVPLTRPEHRDRGDTVVRASGLTHAFEKDLATSTAVNQAAVRCTGTGRRVGVWIDLDLAPGASMDKARSHVSDCLERFTRTSGLTTETMEVSVRPVAARRQVT